MNYSLPPASAQELLRLLAERYRGEAARAYAAGRDDDAATWRSAALDIDALGARLPVLPAAPGPTPRGGGA